MKTAFLLILQLALMMSAQAWFPSPFGLFGENAEGALKFWQEITELSALPFCLLILSFSKSGFIRTLKLIWGLCLSGASGLVLVKAPQFYPEVTSWGIILLGFSTVLGLALSLFSFFELAGVSGVKSGSLAPVIPIPQLGKNSPGEAVPKVEGV